MTGHICFCWREHRLNSVLFRDAIFNLNVRGTFITCQEAIRWMVSHGGGSIVNISSTASEKAYSPAASYGPSKAAVNNMSYNMAVEYGPQQVLDLGHFNLSAQPIESIS